ncbi:putative phosphoesterase [Methanohalophilus levihalophilus]|uniref:metallophosphoesterase family protein n=1 Tax=Methanohalophilus levihalophilus TaxID=1431282 RepID=UPI001AEAAAE8|nr:metallophosphoesterase family protein [Methanohalophilus levihalophilus]MBP2029476.1 putative phosphoesterase [Methanohalophilus levihalophilus]
MKILVISDIHGNMEALESVMQVPHDEVLCLGDLVDYGPSPVEVIEFLKSHNIPVIKGNHDNAVATGLECGCSYELKYLSIATRDYTRSVVGKGHIDFLKLLPSEIEREINGTKVHFTHGSPRSFYEYIRPETPENELREMTEEIDADLLFVGHTHIPFEKQVGDLRIVNVGSVGQPRNGDPRASCVLLDTATMEIEFIKTEYKSDKTISGIREKLPYPDDLISILKTGKTDYAKRTGEKPESEGNN